MPTENSRTVDPSPQNFAGDSFAQTAKRLFHATRPKFFPASLLPIIAGTAWGFSATDSFGVLVFVLALFATMCVHAASNVLNDVGDESGGTDRQNDDRVYPYTGGSRFIQTGIMSASEMARWGITLLALAAIAGIALIALKGPVVLYFGLAGVALSVLYSLGPARLASLGIGETAVAVGLGVIPVAGAAWLQGAELNLELLLFTIPVSAWVAAILLINEVPDVAADGATGKHNALPLLAPLVPAALLVLAFKAGAAIRVGIRDRGRMTAAIESTLAIHTIGSIWLVACVLFLYWRP